MIQDYQTLGNETECFILEAGRSVVLEQTEDAKLSRPVCFRPGRVFGQLAWNCEESVVVRAVIAKHRDMFFARRTRCSFDNVKLKESLSDVVLAAGANGGVTLSPPGVERQCMQARTKAWTSDPCVDQKKSFAT